MIQQKNHWLNNGRTLAMLAAAGFSLKSIFVKLAYAGGSVDAITLLSVRMIISLPAFIWLIRSGNRESLSRHDMLALLILGMFGYYLSSLFDFIGLQYISAGFERLILFTYPSLVVLMEAALKRKRVPGQTWVALALIYAGLIAAFWHDLHIGGDRDKVMIGGAWVLLSSLSFSVYYLGTGVFVKRIGSTRLAGSAGAVASGFVIGQFLLTRPISLLLVLPLTIWGWGAMMALFSTVLPIWLAARAVARLGASHTAAIGSLGPAITIALGWIILKEPFSVIQIIGMTLVIGGVIWMGRNK